MDAWMLKLDAKGDTLWTRTYGGPYADDAWSVQQTRDGGFIVAGSYGVSDLPLDAPWLIKTDANGDTLWTRTYGLGAAYDVRQTFDGGYVLVGHCGGRFLMVKTDANGETLWTKLHSGPDEEGYAVRQTQDSGYAALAKTESKMWLLRTDLNGDDLWVKELGNGSVRWNSLTTTTDGGFAVAALVGSVRLGSSNKLIRLNGDGETLWTRVYQSEPYYGYAVQQTVDNGFIIAGYAGDASADGADIWLVRTDADGDTLWTKTVGDEGTELTSSIWQASDSGYIVAGWTTSYGGTKAYFVKTKPDRAGGIEERTSDREKPSLPGRDRSRAIVYDASGRSACRLSDIEIDVPGQLLVRLTGRLQPGVYFVHVQDGQTTRRLKTVFIR